MAEAIIEKLKVKPQPKRPTAVEFKIGQQNKLEIQDGRKESVLNRDEIMERLKGIKQVKSLDSKVEEKVKKRRRV